MDAPAVTVTPEAAAFVRARGGALTLRRTPRHGCCGGTVALAVAEPEAPPDATAFACHDLGDLTLYVEPDLDGPLRVGLDRLLGFASLFVEGADATM